MPSIIITGAGSGVGRATAHAFLNAGWQVGLMGRREAPLAETAGSHDALVLPCDVADEAATDAAFATAAAHWGRIDALFNNAGVSLGGAPIDELAVEDIRHLLDVNIMGAFIAARAAFGQMRRQDPQGGRIINNGSVSAYVPRWGSAPYTASKHGMIGLMRGLAEEYMGSGITFNALCPGYVDTPIVARNTQENPNEYEGVPVTATGLAHLADCQQLAELELVGARLDDAALGKLSLLTALRDLDLDEAKRCDLTAAGMRNLVALPHLQRLRICDCPHLDDDGLAVLARSRSLEHVILIDCPGITGRGIQRLLAAPQLHSLELDGIAIEGMVPQQGPTPALRKLRLKGTHGAIANLDRLDLREIKIEHTVLPDGTLRVLAASSVEQLHIHRCENASKQLPDLRRAKSLQRLLCTRPRERVDWSAALAAWQQIATLRELVLIQANVRDEDCAALFEATQLHKLDLRSTKTTAPLHAKLRTALPDCRILTRAPWAK